MELARQKLKARGIFMAGIWIAVLLLLGVLVGIRIEEVQRREQIALLGRLESLYTGQNADLLVTFMQDYAAADYERGRILLEGSSYASAGYRQMGKTEVRQMLAWCGAGFLVVGLAAIIYGAKRDGKRYQEAESLGSALLASNHEIPPLFSAELQYLGTCFQRYQEQVRKEKAVIEKDRRELSLYLENVSHQIKTPLTGIALCHEFLEETETAPRKKELLARSRVQLESIQTLVRQLLQLARLDAGRENMKLERVSLERLLERPQKTIYSLGKEKELLISWQYEKEALVLCDCFWMQEALINLLRNALEHTPDHGWIRIWAESDFPWLEINIRDSGPGIGKEERANIFRRFYTGTTAENGKNVGIGLNLAHEIVAKHGGQLTLVEHVGDGAWFRLRLYT